MQYKKEQRWSWYIPRNMFWKLSDTSANNNVSPWTYKSWYSPELFNSKTLQTLFCSCNLHQQYLPYLGNCKNLLFQVNENHIWYLERSNSKSFSMNSSAFPPGIKMLWRRRSDVSLYVPVTSQVRLKWNTQRRLDGTSRRRLNGASPRRLIGTS